MDKRVVKNVSFFCEVDSNCQKDSAGEILCNLSKTFPVSMVNCVVQEIKNVSESRAKVELIADEFRVGHLEIRESKRSRIADRSEKFLREFLDLLKLMLTRSLDEQKEDREWWIIFLNKIIREIEDVLEMPCMKIVKAVYGTGESKQDVTEVVKKLHIAVFEDSRIFDRLKFVVDNYTLGCDPAMFRVKKLEIDYYLQGQLRHVEFNEGETVNLEW